MIATPIGKTASGKTEYKINPYKPGRMPYASLGEKLIPCGQCLECRLQYARQWADRCMLEAQYHDSNFFLTLTYDNDHVPIHDHGAMSLQKKDLQDFHKRLRTRLTRDGYPDHIRYYAAGEYGDQTKRPHYHDIVFGLFIPDLEYSEESKKSGSPLFRSKYLDDIWTNGNVLIGEVTWESCAYTARYVTKKQKGLTADVYEKLGVEPEFVLMSRKPGIGKDYYNDHPELYDYDGVWISTKNGGKMIKPARYFDKLLETDDPFRFEQVKARRNRVGHVVSDAKLYGTTLDYFEQLGVDSKALADKTKILKRDTI